MANYPGTLIVYPVALSGLTPGSLVTPGSVSSQSIITTTVITGPAGSNGNPLAYGGIKTANFTATQGFAYDVNATSGAITATLPTSTGQNQLSIKKSAGDSSTNIVTLSGTINGTAGASIPLRLTGQGKVLTPDGSGGWYIYAGDLGLPQLDARYVNIGAVQAGTNVTLTGTGTVGSPLVINSTASGGGSGTPGGGTTQMQYNNGGAFAGDSSNRWDNTNKTLLLGTATSFGSGDYLHIAGTLNDTVQANVMNLSNGASASSDFVATADTGTNSTNYIDMGINSSAYADTGFTITGALDGYLYTNGGSLAIGTQTAGKTIKFHTGGTLAANLRLSVIDTGLEAGANATYNLGTTNYFAQGRITRLYVNTTAYIDGATAGQLAVTGSLLAAAPIFTTSETINGAAATNRSTFYTTAGSKRWEIQVSNTAESGSNAGSNWGINTYDDTGAYLNTPWNITRSTGFTNVFLGMGIAGGLSTDTLSVSGTSTMRSIEPSASNTYNLGTTNYFAQSRITRIYLNATAYLDGATSGQIGVTGNLVLANTSQIVQQSTTRTDIGFTSTNDARVELYKSTDGTRPGYVNFIYGGTTSTFNWINYNGSSYVYTATMNNLGYLTLGGTGTAITPTHTLTIPSVANGIAFYNTTDQTTNYERVRMSWASNVYQIIAERGGTSTVRNLQIGTTNVSMIIAAAGSSSGLYQLSNGTSAAGGVGLLVGGSWQAASGISIIHSISPTINQSGTAGYTALLINPTETSIGSGIRTLADFQVGGTSLANISRNGFLSAGQTAVATAKVDIGASAAGSASIRVRPGVAPTTPNDGDVWYDSTLKSFMRYANGMNMTPIAQFYSNIGNTSIGNVTTNTSLLGATAGTNYRGTKTFAAGALNVIGKKFRIWMGGVYTTVVATTGASATITVGGVTVATVTVSALANAVSNFLWSGSVICEVTATGTTGTIRSTGELMFNTGATGKAYGDLSGAGANSAAIDLTAALNFDVLGRFSSSQSTQDITATYCYIEMLN